MSLSFFFALSLSSKAFLLSSSRNLILSSRAFESLPVSAGGVSFGGLYSLCVFYFMGLELK